MKKISIIILIFFSSFASSQTYKFDKSVTYERTNLSQNFKNIEQKLINSNDETYVLNFITERMVSVQDYNTNVIHEYRILEDNADGILNMEYTNSCDHSRYYKRLRKNKNIVYRGEMIEENVFLFKSFKSDKSKKVICEIKIVVDETERDELNYLCDLDDELMASLKSYLDENKNYTIKEITFTENGSKGTKLKLLQIDENEFQLTLPTKLYYDCIYPLKSILKN